MHKYNTNSLIQLISYDFISTLRAINWKGAKRRNWTLSPTAKSYVVLQQSIAERKV